jgi:hypothetical protein
MDPMIRRGGLTLFLSFWLRVISKGGPFFFAGLLVIYPFPVSSLETKEIPTNSEKEASELNHFQTEEENNCLRLVISGNGKINAYRSYILHQPLRLIVDIPNVILRDPQRFIPLIHPIIEAIRFGIHQGKVRIVIDLKSVVIPRYRIFQKDHSLTVLIETWQDVP